MDKKGESAYCGVWPIRYGPYPSLLHPSISGKYNLNLGYRPDHDGHFGIPYPPGNTILFLQTLLSHMICTAQKWHSMIGGAVHLRFCSSRTYNLRSLTCPHSGFWSTFCCSQFVGYMTKPKNAIALLVMRLNQACKDREGPLMHISR